MITYIAILVTLTLGGFLILVIAELMALHEIKSWKRNTKELINFPLKYEPLKGDRGNAKRTQTSTVGSTTVTHKVPKSPKQRVDSSRTR